MLKLFFRRCLILAALVWLGLGLAQAQIQRSMVNPSFEQAFTGTRAAGLNAFFTQINWIAVDQNEIPGWNTTAPSVTNGCPAGGNIVAAYTCNPIELWANSFNGLVPAQGIVSAELNAYTNSKLYQNVCFINGEIFTFNFAHHGRSGADRAQFQIGAANTVILDVTTGTTGTGTINAGGGATAPTATGIANGWTRYAGSYTYTGATGVQPIGFSAVSTSTGNLSTGNELDDINIAFKPYLEFTAATTSSIEGGAAAPPKLKVVGIVPVGGLTLTLTVSGTGVLATDFNYTGATTLTAVSGTATTLTFTIPAGNYDDAQANNVFSLPLNVINNTIVQDNRTVIFGMPANAPANPFVISGTGTCGAAAITQVTHTIIDNDIDLKTTKTASAAAVANGGAVVYTVTYENVTPAVLTLAPLTAHDAASVAISDPVPAGATFSAWTCVATGTVCPAASGAGAISANANLPVGTKLTYTINATVPSNGTCAAPASVVNTSTIANTATSPSGATLNEGASVVGNAGYVFQPNTASATTKYPACANLTLTKNDGRTTVLSGDTLTYVVVLTNTGPDAADGTVLQDSAVAGLSFTAVSCSYSNGASGPASPTVAQLQAGFSIPTLPSTGVTTCLITAQVL